MAPSCEDASAPSLACIEWTVTTPAGFRLFSPPVLSAHRVGECRSIISFVWYTLESLSTDVGKLSSRDYL